jgi:hypothetical protein
VYDTRRRETASIRDRIVAAAAACLMAIAVVGVLSRHA